MLSAVVSFILGAAVASAETSDKDGGATLGFDVYREGERIGRHEITFTPAGETLRVDVAIDLRISFLFFTAYSYEHRVEEVWRDGRLIAMSSSTDNNGEPLQVSARAVEGGLKVMPAEGQAYLVAEPILPTTYWHPRTLEADRLLNTQTGEAMDVAVRSIGDREQVDTPWGPVAAQQYLVEAARDWSLWYDPAGCLAGVAFADKRGTEIEYRLTDYIAPEGFAGMSEVPDAAPYRNCAIVRAARATADAAGKGLSQ